MFPQTEHRRRATVLTILLILAVHFGTADAATLALAWDPSSDPDVVTHAVYYSEVGSSEATRIEVGNTPNVILTDLQDGKTYFIYAVAIDTTGQESEPSNALTYTPSSGSTENALSEASLPEIVDSTSADVAPSGQALTQSFTTVGGQQYVLTFRLGARSDAEDAQEHTAVLTITGNEVILYQPVVLVVPGKDTSWAEQNVVWTADSETTTVALTDTDQDGIELLWEEVRLTQ
jgi:hypothetical protein